jgi:hypothetical protein
VGLVIAQKTDRGNSRVNDSGDTLLCVVVTHVSRPVSKVVSLRRVIIWESCFTLVNNYFFFRMVSTSAPRREHVWSLHYQHVSGSYDVDHYPYEVSLLRRFRLSKETMQMIIAAMYE